MVQFLGWNTPTNRKGGLLMKVDPKTVVFVLELVGSLAIAAAGVVAKHAPEWDLIELER